MVYYPISADDLEALIGAHDDQWRNKAATRTDDNVTAKALAWSDSIWSDIKAVYMDHQWDKCVYCEFPLGGKSTQDIEHYRPKGKISAWPRKNAKTYPFATGDAVDTGYYWLAYDSRNYAASCKDCNSALKRDAFPIAGTRGSANDDVSALNGTENPLLLFPFGDWGDDPSEYFDYSGIFVRPKSGLSQDAARRAEVTIDFFRLNERRNLLRARYTVIAIIWSNVELRETSTRAATVQRAEQTILQNIVNEAPHSLCARAFLALMQADPDAATALSDVALGHLQGLGYHTLGRASG